MKDYSLDKIKRELQAGNNYCLKVFFEKYGNYCLKNLRRKTNCSIEDAEDILMDSMLNFREKIVSGKIEYLTNTKHYLFTTCYNMWLAKYHKEKSQFIKTDILFDEYYDTDNIISRKSEMKDLGYKALNRLGDKCQKILSLYYLENLRMDDISKILGFANAAVAKTSKSRCFKKLIKEVKDLQSQKEVTK